MVELLPRLLPLEDEEISQMTERELKKRGVDIHTGVTVDKSFGSLMWSLPIFATACHSTWSRCWYPWGGVQFTRHRAGEGRCGIRLTRRSSGE